MAESGALTANVCFPAPTRKKETVRSQPNAVTLFCAHAQTHPSEPLEFNIAGEHRPSSHNGILSSDVITAPADHPSAAMLAELVLLNLHQDISSIVRPKALTADALDQFAQGGDALDQPSQLFL